MEMMDMKGNDIKKTNMMHPSDYARIRIFHGWCIFPLTAVTTGYTGAFAGHSWDRGRVKVGTEVLEL